MGIALGITVGIVLAAVWNIHIPVSISAYVAVGILAALDSVVGGLCASMSKSFNLKIFITGFITNSIIAVSLTYLGKQLGIDIYIAAVVVFGTRLIQNFAVIRRLLLNKLEKNDTIQ